MCLKTDECWINFRLNILGLFVHNVRDGVSEVCVKNKNKLHAYSLLQTVDTNSTKDTKEKTRMTNEAKYLAKRMVGTPLHHFSRHLNDKLIRNTTVKSIDTRRGELTSCKEAIKYVAHKR